MRYKLGYTKQDFSLGVSNEYVKSLESCVGYSSKYQGKQFKEGLNNAFMVHKQ